MCVEILVKESNIGSKVKLWKKKNVIYFPYGKEMPVSAIENAEKLYFKTEQGK